VFILIRYKAIVCVIHVLYIYEICPLQNIIIIILIILSLENVNTRMNK